ncbi:MAG: hypothetical protein ACJ715_10260 [Ornithinibacter sp.]
MLRAAESGLVSAPRPSGVAGSRAEWAEVVTTAQRVINAASAVQDEAIVAVCAIEDDVLEDGTVVEGHRAAGHVALDGPAIVSGALNVSTVHAEHRVRSAVRLAADEPAGSDTATGLAALHAAMRHGDLDAYRAGVVAEELEQAPTEVAEAVLGTLASHWARDTGPQLRARCRTVLSRISPDLLRQRATKAREQCGLRRWAEEPGVDKWEGTFPSQDAARAWAAIDARAHELVTDGTVSRIDRARAQALIDLVTGSATITTVVTLTVPASPGDLCDSGGPPAGPAGPAVPTPDTPEGGGAAGLSGGVARDAQGERVALGGSLVVAEGRGVEEHLLRGGTSACTESSGDLVEVVMGTRGERVLVTRAFLEVVVAGIGAQTVERPCHPVTGALLDHTVSASYRPPASMAALVRQRDGRCRFPGCQVAARFCDLDHVRPWPSGSTTPTNLICLCRRHHRIKQRAGWSVRLGVDGRCTWTDPTGKRSTTSAVDALHVVVLRAPRGVTSSSTFPTEHSRRPEQSASLQEPVDGDRLGDGGSITRYDLLGRVGDQFSGLEFTLEHHAAAITTADLNRAADLSSASLMATGIARASRCRCTIPTVLVRAPTASSWHLFGPTRRRVARGGTGAGQVAAPSAETRPSDPAAFGFRKTQPGSGRHGRGRPAWAQVNGRAGGGATTRQWPSLPTQRTQQRRRAAPPTLRPRPTRPRGRGRPAEATHPNPPGLRPAPRRPGRSRPTPHREVTG